MWKANNEKYIEWCDKILAVKNEQKELSKDIKQMKENASKDGCNPRVLNQMLRLASMQKADKEALEEALEK